MSAPSLLAARPLTDAERAHQDEDPRPGVWADEAGADLRALTQDETDALIRFELYSIADRAERAVVVAACGGQPGMALLDDREGTSCHRASCQRGGIDSDPLVRVLAHRAWGDRDRRWFDERGVRKGDLVTEIEPEIEPEIDSEIDPRVVVRAWDRDSVVGSAMDDALPGGGVRVRDTRGAEYACRVGCRLRDEVQSRTTIPPRAGA